MTLSKKNNFYKILDKVNYQANFHLFYIHTYSIMSVKIDTKEKFSVIIPETSEISANMSDELKELLNSYLNHSIPHVILSLRNVKKMDNGVAEMILNIQVGFYEKNCSFIICETLKELMFLFENSINITPTESEAWDIIQMEEIERELLNDFD